MLDPRNRRPSGTPSSRASRGGFVAGSAAFATIGIVKGPARAAQFEFKCGSTSPPDHPGTILMTQMWAAIEQESGGRVRTQFFPNSVLGSDAAMFGQLRVGALHFDLAVPGVLASVVPAADIGYIGFVFKDTEEALRAMDGGLGGYIRQESAAKGIYACRAMWDSGMAQIAASASSHPIRTPEDLHGFKIRLTPSRIAVDLFKDLGAIPTPLSIAEVYTALQTKLVDGQASPLNTVVVSRIYEVTKYLSLTNHSWSGQWLLANADVWKSLPPDLQDIIERNNTKYATMERAALRTVNANAASMLAQRQGMIVNQVNQAPFRAPLQQYFTYWANAFGPTAWGLLQNAVGRKLS